MFMTLFEKLVNEFGLFEKPVFVKSNVMSDD